MKESYRKGIANHPGPESCVGAVRCQRSVDRGTCRQGIELRNHRSGVPTPLSVAEGNTAGGVIGEPEDPAQSETPACMETPAREPGDPTSIRRCSRRRAGWRRPMSRSPTCTPVGSRTVA